MIPVTAAPGPPRPSSFSLSTLDFFLLKSQALPAGLVHYQGIICFHNLHFFLSISQGLAGDAAGRSLAAGAVRGWRVPSAGKHPQPGKTLGNPGKQEQRTPT